MFDLETDLQTKAASYIAEAERVLKRPTFWGLLRQQTENYDDAGDLYKQAANTYKFLKDWPAAYRCYMCAAKYIANNTEISNLNNVTEATRAAVVPIIIQAAEALEHFDPHCSIMLYTTVANLYILLNKYDYAAKITAYAALLMRTEGDLTQSLKTYQLAAEYYRVSPYGQSKEIDCLDMVAKICIECAEKVQNSESCTYAREAAYTYKTIALKQSEYTRHTIAASFRVYQPLFNSIICMFYLDDLVAIKNWYIDCCRIMPAFETINDGVFLGKLINIIELSEMGIGDVEKNRSEYQKICRERENEKPLETWMLSPLNHQLTRITTDSVENIDLS